MLGPEQLVGFFSTIRPIFSILLRAHWRARQRTRERNFKTPLFEITYLEPGVRSLCAFLARRMEVQAKVMHRQRLAQRGRVLRTAGLDADAVWQSI